MEVDGSYLAKTEASQKLQEINDMIWIAKLTFGRGIFRILFCPMILYLDGEVVWSSLDYYT